MNRSTEPRAAAAVDWRAFHHRLAGEGSPGPPGALDGVADYGDARAEWNHLHQSAGLLTAQDWRRFTLRGPDAVSYLHRRVSNSLEGLAEGEGVHALQLDAHGRMQADMLVYRVRGGLDILCHRTGAEEAFAIVERFTLMDEVEVARDWEGEGTLAVGGTAAGEVLGARAEAGFSVAEVEIAGRRCRIYRDGRYRTPVYRIIAGLDALGRVAEELRTRCVGAGGGLAGTRAAEFLRIEQGVTLFGRDTDAETIPLDAGLEGAVDFNKGCFPGQETLAKIHNLGHPARRLVRLAIEGDRGGIADRAMMVPDGGEEVEAGTLTSLATIEGIGAAVGLGTLKWKHRGASEVRVKLDGGDAVARVEPAGAMTPPAGGGGET